MVLLKYFSFTYFKHISQIQHTNTFFLSVLLFPERDAKRIIFSHIFRVSEIEYVKEERALGPNREKKVCKLQFSGQLPPSIPLI